MKLFLILTIFLLISCGNELPKAEEKQQQPIQQTKPIAKKNPPKKTAKSIHVFVALCDNKSQGIVPVPAALGNGDDPNNNLYWGAMYGIKTYFRKSKQWQQKLFEKYSNNNVLERVVFKHKTENVYFVADAYRGSEIKQATIRFITACSGKEKTLRKFENQIIGLNGAADLVCYIGHNGLMDFNLRLKKQPHQKDTPKVIALACKSKNYFSPIIQELGATPLLLTNGFMAPEAYTLEAALESWISGKDNFNTKLAAAKAYQKYQKCSLKAAQNLFYTSTR